MVINSQMGRSPAMAAPMPAPTITPSEIGVSLIRLSPNSFNMPCVTA